MPPRVRNRPARAAFAAEADALVHGGKRFGNLAKYFDTLGTPALVGLVFGGIGFGLASAFVPNPTAIFGYTMASVALGVLAGRYGSPHKRRHQALEKAREAAEFANSLPASATLELRQEAWRAATMATRETYGTSSATLETRFRVEDETATKAQERLRVAVESSTALEADADEAARQLLRAEGRRMIAPPIRGPDGT
jgi:hypothetical protein